MSLTDQIIWTVSTALATVAVLQILHILWLGLTISKTRMSRHPNKPIMPTTPHDSGHPANQPDDASSSPNDNIVGKMVILRGITNPSEIPLPSDEFGIGRFYSPESTILVALDERSISRRHAIFVGDTPTREYYLTDTHSSYGTHIQIGNRFEPLTPGKGQRIYNEDVVQFGNLVTVRFILPCQTRPSGSKMY